MLTEQMGMWLNQAFPAWICISEIGVRQQDTRRISIRKKPTLLRVLFGFNGSASGTPLRCSRER